MHIKNVFCPVDLADQQHAAVNYAASLAESFDANLLIGFVYDDRVVYEVGYGGAVAPPIDLDEMKRQLEEIVPTHGNATVKHVFLTGSPAETIVEYATENDVDLIVMGTRGRRGISRVLVGSVAENVMRKANCPVITIRDALAELQTTESS